MMGRKERCFAPLVNVSVEGLVRVDHFYRLCWLPSPCVVPWCRTGRSCRPARGMVQAAQHGDRRDGA